MIKIKPSEITPEHIYLSRRRFMRLGGLALGSLALAACGAEGNLAPDATGTPSPAPTPTKTQAPATATPGLEVSQTTDEMGNELTDYEAVTSFNNFYEFSMDKRAVAPLAQDFEFEPWQVEVTGLVHKPQIFDLDDIRHGFSQQERIYRLRCVEAWSMVIPWLGFPLAEMLKAVEPTSKAKYVRFRTVYESAEMPGTQGGRFPWPYIEGLRLDEAMHDLTILATGLYGKDLPPQNGAPVRLVVPWKYGFKSIKSIVRIDLVEEMPTTFWMSAAPTEYGFYANVNPEVDHPRWSQAGERRIGGERGLIKTLMFNGYAEEVAHLYDGMNLVENF